MKRLVYSCTLLSDVVMNANAATEGFNRSLSYIPGAKFLGLVAGRLYDLTKQTQTLDLFHNATVRFGDAHPVLDKDVLYTVPTTWYYVKGDESPLQYYLNQELDDVARRTLRDEKDIQLEQARERYLFAGIDGWQTFSVQQNFSIKSAYDTGQRRAADSMMFGYFTLKKDTRWQFCIDIDKPNYEALLDEVLLDGPHRIGRSKSAEYGLVNIEKQAVGVDFSDAEIPQGHTTIYAFSNLCFVDADGRYTIQPSPEQLLLPPGSTIDWARTQLRTRPYLNWNQHRKNRDPDRLIIEKGSVFSVHLSESVPIDRWLQGVGVHRAEGFGQVVLNPDFLQAGKTFAYQLDQRIPHFKELPKVERARDRKVGHNDQLILEFLNARTSDEQNTTQILQLINAFIEEFFHDKYQYHEISSSQWGQVRRIAKAANSDQELDTLLFDSKEGFLKNGQSFSIWRSHGKVVHLRKYLAELDTRLSKRSFLMKLATEMAKTTTHAV